MLSDSDTGTVPQGWYTDPLEPADVRWWTGSDWTHHVQPRPFAPLPMMSPELVDVAG
jgi:hypothetical protein